MEPPVLVVEFAGDHLDFYPAGDTRGLTEALRKQLKLEDADRERFRSWAADYEKLIGDANRPLDGPSAEEELLRIGGEMFALLNREQTLEAALDLAPPLQIEFTLPTRRPAADGQAFLELPWELLAEQDAHLALDLRIDYRPVRRLGLRSTDAAGSAPSPHCLSLLFMAAAPDGVPPLQYELEESRILQAADKLGLDMHIEESGECGQLGATWNSLFAQGVPDVLHLSCHGGLEENSNEPFLALENSRGGLERVRTRDLTDALGEHLPRLLFVSACETAHPAATLGSLALGLLRLRAPAVLGWCGSIRDSLAIRFATTLYAQLAKAQSLYAAVARAREAVRRQELDEAKNSLCSQDSFWHMARFYCDADAGAPLVQRANGPRRMPPQNTGIQEFLDAHKEVPVAGRYEFVGRRRQLQQGLRVLQDNGSGLLLCGMGRQGKSSLAARIANRLPGSWQRVVVYGGYRAVDILNALADGLTDPRTLDAAREIQAQYRDRLRDNPGLLRDALRKLFAVPADPLLLVLDDYERCLDYGAAGDGLPPVKHPEGLALAAAIEAFTQGNTQARLVLTCREQFTLLHNGQDLAARLHPIQLPPMRPHERRKQALARRRALEIRLEKTGAALAQEEPLLEDCLKLSQGNPGLLDKLYTLSLEAPDTCTQALGQIKAYYASNTAPQEEETRAFLDALALETTLAVLSPTERASLALLRNLDLPIPRQQLHTALESLPAARYAPTLERAAHLGLCDAFPDTLHPARTALQLNRLAAPKLPQAPEQDYKDFAAALAGPLYAAWGGEESRQRSYTQDLAIARLCLTAGDAELLEKVADDAAFGLYKSNEYIQGEDFVTKTLALLRQKGRTAPPPLLRQALCIYRASGQMKEALECAELALAAHKLNGQPDNPQEYAIFLKDYARLLKQQGQPDQALDLLEESAALLRNQTEYKREHAITLGEKARILKDKGDIEQALKLLDEVLQVYEALGDTRSRAVTLGDIACILTDKGDIEQALKLHYEELQVYETLGDTKSKAATLIDIARILKDKGDIEQALNLHQEQLQVYEALGDTKSRAVTLGDIAHILTGKGDIEQALKLHQEQLQVYETLGDTKSRAVTLGDIARILKDRGDIEQALNLLHEALQVYEALGDTRGISVTHFDLGQLVLVQDDTAGADEHLITAHGLFQTIADEPGICVVGRVLARLRHRQGRQEEALELLERSLRGFEQMGFPAEIERTKKRIAAIKGADES